MQTAKVFKNGNSQAVRLPKDFRPESQKLDQIAWIDFRENRAAGPGQ